MSRKLFLLYIVIILATLGAFVPPIIVWTLSLMHKQIASFQILGSTEWVSMISLVVTTYFGSNVWEKHVALKNGVAPKDLDKSVIAAKNSAIKEQINVDNINEPSQNNEDSDKEALKDALKHGQ